MSKFIYYTPAELLETCEKQAAEIKAVREYADGLMGVTVTPETSREVKRQLAEVNRLKKKVNWLIQFIDPELHVNRTSLHNFVVEEIES